MSSGLGIVEIARRLAHYQWVEERLFETLGAWTVTIPEPAVKVVVGPHGARHAEHAEQWARHRPDVRDAGPSGAKSPGPSVDALFAAVRELTEPEQTIEKLVAVYRVILPALVRDYEEHLAATSVVADGPVIRALELVLADEERELAEGEAVLQSVLEAADANEREHRQRVALVELLEPRGGLIG
jgi:hypothetical protein